MTIGEAIKLVDKLKPNQYPQTLKIKWLSKLDGQIFGEVFSTHEESPVDNFTGYDEETPQSTALLVPYPFDEDIYSFYLQAAVDRENGEISKYNATQTAYNGAYQVFQDWYNRTHLPKSQGRFRF